MPKKKTKITYFQWLDAVASTGWNPRTSFQRGREHVSLCEAVGFVIAEDKDAITIAACIDDETHPGDPDCTARITIPKGWIRSKHYLKVKGR